MRDVYVESGLRAGAVYHYSGVAQTISLNVPYRVGSLASATRRGSCVLASGFTVTDLSVYRSSSAGLASLAMLPDGCMGVFSEEGLGQRANLRMAGDHPGKRTTVMTNA